MNLVKVEDNYYTEKSVALLYNKKKKKKKHQEKKLRINLIYHCIKKNKIPRNKLT